MFTSDFTLLSSYEIGVKHARLSLVPLGHGVWGNVWFTNSRLVRKQNHIDSHMSSESTCPWWTIQLLSLIVMHEKELSMANRHLCVKLSHIWVSSWPRPRASWPPPGILLGNVSFCHEHGFCYIATAVSRMNTTLWGVTMVYHTSWHLSHHPTVDYDTYIARIYAGVGSSGVHFSFSITSILRYKDWTQKIRQYFNNTW